MKRIYFFFLAILLASCASMSKQEVVMNYTAADFQRVINEKNTDLFTLKNKNGMTVTLTNYGAKIVSVFVTDKSDQFADVILGFRSVDEYVKNNASHGATVGPFANRIARGTFTIDSVVYDLPKNNGGNCLHSGPQSLYRQVWDAVQNGNSVEMSVKSADGEWGFPGNKEIKVTFTLTENNELKIEYQAVTDKPTHFNLTNHSYFNLRGEGNGNILDHVAVINSRQVTQVDSLMIPTGEIVDITGSPLDFSSPVAFGERIDADHPQLKIAKGYDFNYILDNSDAEPTFAASVFEPESGRYMEVFTTEPGVQLYTGNHLKGAETGKSGQPYETRTGFCLETQHYPDSPNQPTFPSTLTLPGETLHSVTIYRFSVKK